MSWLEHHRQSEQYASKAEVTAQLGDDIEAQKLYAIAAQAEERALDELGHDKPRTYGITAVSAVALYLKAAQWSAAKTLAHRYLGSGRLPKFARRQLKDLLDSIEMRQVGIDPHNARMHVSAKGSEIVMGGAPLNSVVAVAKNLESLIYRTAEYIKNLPHRKRGEPSKEIRNSYRPWILQSQPGSYQFAVSVQETRQLDMFDPDDIHPKQIIDRLFDILQACAGSPRDELSSIVPDDDYRKTFLKLTRDLAPTENGDFSQIDIRSASGTQTIALIPGTRGAINEVIRDDFTPSSIEYEQTEIRGILRALHLDRDWIEIVPHGVEKGRRIYRAGDEVDDRIGPMVNHSVLVRAAQAGDKLHFLDIEADE